ncbi:MAG: SH3 domain-containing protein [Anaerolineae bacterium]|nr:SH3 domain-containing protein [Anaerolineae bacterium]
MKKTVFVVLIVWVLIVALVWAACDGDSDNGNGSHNGGGGENSDSNGGGGNGGGKESLPLEALDSSVPVRDGPSLGYGEIGYIAAGTTYAATGTNRTAEWVQIDYKNQEGWVCAADSSLHDAADALPETDGAKYSCYQSHLGSLDGVLTGVNPAKAEILYINGIMVTYKQHLKTLELIEDAFKTDRVMGIYNETGGFITDVAQAFDDIIEGRMGQRVGPENRAAESLERQIKRRGSDPLIIVAHSQGTAILATALFRLEPDRDLSTLVIYTYANAAALYPAGPTYRHCVHQSDIVRFSPFYERFVQDARNQHAEFANAPNPGSIFDFMGNHELDGYLASRAAGLCPF